MGLNKGLKINLLHSCSHCPGAAELPAPSLAGLLSSEVELLPAPLQGVLAVSGDAHRVVVSVVQPRDREWSRSLSMAGGLRQTTQGGLG